MAEMFDRKATYEARKRVIARKMAHEIYEAPVVQEREPSIILFRSCGRRGGQGVVYSVVEKYGTGERFERGLVTELELFAIR